MNKTERLKAAENAFSLFNVQDHSVTLTSFERTSSYSFFDAGTRYCMDKLREAGFSRVERIVHPADGRFSALDCIMPEAWDLTGRSFLEIISPDVPEYERILADTDRDPIEAAIWSAPTPKGGINGELVRFDDLDPEHPDVRGKWVCWFENDVDINGVRYRKLAEAGAAGLVLGNPNLLETAPDHVTWFNGQGYNGWYHEKEAPRLPVFSISALRIVKLMDLLKKQKVFLHGEMNTRIYDGEIYTVTAVIPGESEEEYALLAHIYEPFVGDDSLGFGLACELGRMLVQRKVRLKKTLRVVFSMELYGFSAWLADPERRRKIQAAMNLDSFSYLNRDIGFRKTPISLPGFTDWFFRDWFKSLRNFEWSEFPGNLSDDTFTGDSSIGFPANWLHPSLKSMYHHNTSRFFTPDWVMVREKFIHFAAGIEALLTLDFRGGYDRRAAEEFKLAAEAVLNNSGLTDYEKSVRLEAEHFRYHAMLLSWQKFSGRKADTAPLAAAYRRFKKKLGEVRPENLSGEEAAALELVPERLVAGQPFCLSRVPYAERRKIMMPRLLWSLFDGRRNLLQCVRIHDGETGGRATPGYIGQVTDSLRYLEKYGYVRLR